MQLPKVIGHRGAAASAPENTLESFRRAALLGAGGIELDAKLAADGTVIVMHDDRLDRTTSGKGPVGDASYRAIAALDAGRWFGARWAGARVPTLRAAIGEALRLGLFLNIEIKPCPGRDRETAAAIVALLRKLWPAGRPLPLLSSFSVASLETARDLAPDLPRGLLVWNDPEAWRREAGRLGLRTLHCARQYLPSNLRAVRAAGLGLVIYTVNGRAEASRLLRAGADSIITDRPDTVLAA